MVTASDPIASDAWVSPDGKFYQVEYGKHWRTAHLILNPKCKNPSACWIEDPKSKCRNFFGTKHLESKGWLHLSGGNILYGKSHEITNSQVDVLFELRDHIENSSFKFKSRFLNEFARLFAATKEAEQFGAW